MFNFFYQEYKYNDLATRIEQQLLALSDDLDGLSELQLNNFAEQLVSITCELITLRQSIRQDINKLANQIYLRDDVKLCGKCVKSAELLKIQLNNYLSLQKCFSTVTHYYLEDLTADQQAGYWEIFASQEKVEPVSSTAIAFDNFLTICDFSGMLGENRLKACSYLFQNFHQENAKALLSAVYDRASELDIPLIYSDQEQNDRDIIIPQVNGGNDQEKKENLRLLFADYKNIPSEEELESIFNMDLERFISHLESDFTAGDPNVLNALTISIPRKNQVNFVHSYDQDMKVSCCMLDFAQLNLHEFGHAIAYLNGECINPNPVNVILPASMLYSYSNVEEFRNIWFADYAENKLDLEGPQRLGHKSIYSTTVEKFKPINLHHLKDYYGDFIQSEILDNSDFHGLLLRPINTQVDEVPAKKATIFACGIL